ncbi:polyketide synthase-like protein [Xylaria cubensis]|nr:polyketide synthase-like protein [Xylaria cubensis]
MAAESRSESHDDPVCIVGVSCRLPGGVKSASDMWQFLLEKKSAQGVVPPERYNIKGFYNREHDKAGVMNVNGGYFLAEDVRQFDNDFFGINSFEATYVVFECLENSGTPLSKISGSNTAVYVGNFTQDHMLMQCRDPDDLRRYHATGSGLTMLANRISHVFDLHGPSLTLDTACSSSIYCLHLAVTALKANECDGALVAASNLILNPSAHIAASKSGFLSPTSTCHTFDISADGYGRAEAVEAVFLKRLSTAIKDNDTIHAVIRGTATNSNGHTPGVVYPSSRFQEAAIRKAYRNASLEFADTYYIECHGTGTELGDAVELTGLSSCFTSNGRNGTLKIGGSKPNFGHSEAASSLTSLIKVCLAFREGIIPPTRGVATLNPQLQLDRRGMEVVTEAQMWPSELQRASICSSGYGGANAHAVVDSLSRYSNKITDSGSISSFNRQQTFVLPVSAASKASLTARMDTVVRIAESCTPQQLECLTYTLGVRRSHFTQRKSLFVSATELQPAAWEIVQQVVDSPNEQMTEAIDFAFVFTGQGAQYPKMGKELLNTNLTFLSTIRELDEVLQGLPAPYTPEWTLENALRGDFPSSFVTEAARSQPLCTAIQIGLVNILRTWGVTASAVIGHSSGEIAAAYASHLISSSQAILTAFFRGYVIGQDSGCGAMLACGLTAEEAGVLIDSFGLSGQITIACFNARSSVTISGLREAIDRIQSELQARKIFCRLLQTDGRAYHSFMMKAIGNSYEEALRQYFPVNCKQDTSETEMHSTVHVYDERSAVLSSDIDMTKYWKANLEEPVRFETALSHLFKTKRFHIIEIGPHPALKGPVNQVYLAATQEAQRQPLSYSSTLVRGEESEMCMKKLAGKLFISGYDLDWNQVNFVPRSSQILCQDLPPYPWDYSSGLKWSEPRASVELRNRSFPRHELLGSLQLTGDGNGWSWRNVLRVDEVQWIRDHKIGKQVIFPAAGYLAIVIEATRRICSLTDVSTEPKTFDFENVSINSAMVLPEHDDLQQEPLELHTTLSPRRLSAKTTSTNTYDFIISTWSGGQSVVHCVGGVKLSSLNIKKTVSIETTDLHAKWTMDKWRRRFIEEGIYFGPYFQSINSVHVGKNHESCVKCTTSIKQPESQLLAARYEVHPVTIDACLQASLISASQGDIDRFRSYVPVAISRCRIQMPSLDSDNHGTIHGRTQRTGFASLRGDCILENAQGLPVIEMEGVKLSRFMGQAAQTESSNFFSERHPVMRVRWKPDVGRLLPDDELQLAVYISGFLRKCAMGTGEQSDSEIIGALLDLAGHKNPRLQVLRIGPDAQDSSTRWMKLLGKDTAFPRIKSYQSVLADASNLLTFEAVTANGFDVLIHDDILSQYLWDNSSNLLLSVVNDNGMIITRSSDNARSRLKGAGFSIMALGMDLILGTRKTQRSTLSGRCLVILGRSTSSYSQELVKVLTEALLASGFQRADAVSLDELLGADLSSIALCISLIEVECPLLTTLNQQDLEILHSLFSRVHNVLWLTGANILGAPVPDLTLVQGLFRTLRVEQPSLRLATMDIGWLKTVSFHSPKLYESIFRILQNFADDNENEFVLHDDLIYISRFEPDDTMNSVFRRRNAREDETRTKMPLSESGIAKLSIGTVGFTDSIYFQQLGTLSRHPPPGHIDVQVKAVSLNAKDIYALNGRVETRNGTSALEFSGIITDVGSDVRDLQIGDRVVVLKPNEFSTMERVPAWAAHKLLDGEGYAEMATLPAVYGSALYAIRDRAHLRTGESVLVHSGAGAFGTATIALALRVGAIVYTTAGSEARRQFLIEHFGISPLKIFNSRNDSFVGALRAATAGRGVDVVINSLAGELMHASWSCLAPFGRFVEVGKREIIDDGRLEMNVFGRNTTFTAFDLSEMFFQEGKQYQNLLAGLVAEVLQLYRKGEIKTGAIRAFDVSNIGEAYRYFSSKERIGKVVVTLDDPESLIPVAPVKYNSVLSNEKVYLLVGALGGLGRSLTQWMMCRGARKFVFLQRSGCDKPGAQAFVDQLRLDGAKAVVVKGDVTVADDVAASIIACESLGARLGGVVQAAMGLHEDLFSRMTSASWQASVKPKWAGTWNIHNAVENRDIDFFLMTSSMNGTVGTPTESNYCAANSFLDAFAFYRRSQGKPATSLALGMISDVGYIHENPEIESLLLRRGTEPLSENDFLVLVDLAISKDIEGNRSGTHAPPHILTGLETTGIRRYLEQGFQVTNAIIEDPRFSFLATSLEVTQDKKQWNSDKGMDVDAIINKIPWLRNLPMNAAKVLGAEEGASSLEDSIRRALRRRFSHLLLTPIEQITEQRSFAHFGIDSMIAAEFRTWLWNSFKVDVPFLDLLSHKKSLDTVVGLVEQAMAELSLQS